MRNVQDIIKHHVSKFNTFAIAKRFALRNAKLSNTVLMGDDKLYWVTYPGDVDRLMKVGYEAA